MNTVQNNNGTLKHSDVDISLIKVKLTKIQGDEVPLVKYGPYDKDLIIQCPWIKMKQYGIPPGETLTNGAKNDYYSSEEARDSMKFPLDPENCSVATGDSTNADELAAFITTLKAIDKHFKESKEVHAAANIDADDIEKYMPNYRKPKANKKADAKIKYPYMKAKLNTQYPNKTNITTKFFNVDRDTQKTNRIQTTPDYITLEDLEKYYEFNCEQQPVIKFVKVWSQSTGAWGITMKLMMSRIKKSQRTGKDDFTDFIDDSTDSKVHQAPKDEVKASPVKKVEQVVSDDSDEEPVVKKPVVKKPAESDDSDDEVVKKEPVKKAAPKKQVESDDSDDEVVVAKKPAVKKPVESDDSDDEVVQVRKPAAKPVRGKK